MVIALSEYIVATFPARADGPASCGHLVRKGERIHQLGDRRYVCDSCAPSGKEDQEGE